MGGVATAERVVLQDAPTRNGDRGPVGFRVAAAMLATAVLVIAVARLALQYASLGHLSRPWSGTAALILAIALLLCQLPRRLTWPRMLSAILAGVVIVIEVLLLVESSTGVLLPGFDGLLSGAEDVKSLPFGGRPSPLTIGLSIVIATAVLALAWTSRIAVWVSTWCLVLAASASGFLLVELAFPMRIRVDSIFQTTAGSVAASTLMLLGLALAAVCARPYRLPLGPLLTTRTWPLAVFCLGVLVFGTLASQIAQRLVLESAGSQATAQVTALLVQGCAVVALVGFTVWYAAMQQRRAATASFANVVHGAAVPMAFVGSDGLIRDVNPAYEEFLGRPAQVVVGTKWNAHAAGQVGVEEWSSEVWDDLLQGKVARTERREYVRPDKSTVWADVTIARAQDSAGGDEPLLLEQLLDVTAAMVAQQELSYRSRHDALTGLLTRQEISELLDAHREDLPRMATLVAIFDLDNFKTVNAAYGHFVGDQVLTEIGRRLVQLSGPQGQVGRLGGDQFVYVQQLPLMDWTRTVRRAVEALMSTLERDYAVAGFVVRTTASMGVDVGLREKTGEQLLRNASAALAQAKRAGGRRWQMFDDDFHAQAQDRVQLLEQLQAVFRDSEQDQLETWFQPIVNLDELGTAAYEALIRWHHPTRGILVAGVWIEIAETDLTVIHGIGMLTLTQAMQFAAQLPAGRRVSVNVSGAHLTSREFPEFADLALELNRRNPGRLVLELTETTLANMTNPSRARLSQLVDAGIELWADDFGTGYSSMAHLRDLPLTGLKLDKSFVSDLDDPDSPVYRIADGLAGLAEGLGLTTVAEGIETPRQAQRAAAAGWTFGQGWLFGRPNTGSHWISGESAAQEQPRSAGELESHGQG